MEIYPKRVQCMHCSTHVYNFVREIKPGDVLSSSDIESSNPDKYPVPKPCALFVCPECGHMWSGVVVIGEATVFK